MASLVEGGAWHAFINIYDSIKVCIRHSGGQAVAAAAAAGATPAAESLSPALVALCVCLFVCCALHATCKLQHKVKPRSKCNYEKPFELSRGKNAQEKGENYLKIALRSNESGSMKRLKHNSKCIKHYKLLNKHCLISAC